MPLTIHPEDGKTSKWNDQLLSLEQNKDSTGLGKPQIDNILKLLQPPPNDPRFSVALASSHRNLPPAYIQIGGCDPLRDDGFLYERILKESGVKTKTDVYPGLPHRGHVQFPSTKIAQRLEEDLKVGLTWLMEEKE
ncbi:hypothetical protein C8Q75DRAFT_439276 [Abortiporus biennis]|nr:hypothetical protein C8Q75DRAFT_439276 [Abortiporus biennis]